MVELPDSSAVLICAPFPAVQVLLLSPWPVYLAALRCPETSPTDIILSTTVGASLVPSPNNPYLTYRQNFQNILEKGESAGKQHFLVIHNAFNNPP